MQIQDHFQGQIFFKHLTCESKTTSDMISYDLYISLIIRIFFHGYSNFSEERKPPNISHFSCRKIKNNNKLTVWLLAEAATGRVLLKKGVLLKKHLCWILFFNKVADLKPAVLLKKDSCTGVFLWILRIFKSTYFIKHLRTICPALKKLTSTQSVLGGTNLASLFSEHRPLTSRHLLEKIKTAKNSQQ